MTASIARARARGSQLGLTTPLQWEKWGRPARVTGDRRAMKFNRILGCGERGTGVDLGKGEFTSAGSSNHGARFVAYPLWLSAFPCYFWAFRRAIEWGSRPQAKWDFFGVGSSIQFHSVPFTATYLKHAIDVSRAVARNVDHLDRSDACVCRPAVRALETRGVAVGLCCCGLFSGRGRECK